LLFQKYFIIHFIYMRVVKDICNLLKNQRVLVGLGVLVLFVMVVSSYNNKLGLSVSHMNNQSNSNSETDQYPGESAPGGSVAVNPANPAGMNAGPGSAVGLNTVTSGVPSSCLNQQVANPSDLLPHDNNSDWAAANSRGGGELSNVNLLKAGHHAGIDTVGSTLRNSNLQLRSEPPNPRTQVSPWANSTIEPNLMRVPLELGCGPQ
jgi:hypothetical protein